MGDLEIGMTKCFYCGKDKDIIMNTILTEKAAQQIKEMNGKVINKEPCPECKELMEKGIMLLSVRDGESGINPYRTGNMAVITEEGIQKMLSKEKADELMRTRFAFVEDTVWEKLGLPTA